MAAVVAAPFAAKAAATKVDSEVPPGFGSNGMALCRIYRQDGKGKWREIEYKAVRTGDKIICIGRNKDYLFMAYSATVGDMNGPNQWNGHTAEFIPTEINHLMPDQPSPRDGGESDVEVV